jgi:hypothetical protein
MKRLLITLFVSVSVLFVACKTTKMSSEEKMAAAKEIADKIESKDYRISVNWANPTRGGSINLTPYYDLTVRGDSAFAYLPFFGRAYHVAYGGDGGIKFSEPMKNYEIKETKKGDGYDIRFDVKVREFDYRISMTIFTSGESSITVNSSQKDPIAFRGKIDMEEKKR